MKYKDDMKPLQASPKVSVIMPTYNRAHYLPEAIGSVLKQTFDDFELIVVDDGSIDNTEELLQSFDDLRIRYLRQEHRGISATLNAGIRASRGQYIARLDSDDIWTPQMLATQVGTLENHSEAGLVYAKTGAMDQWGVRIPGIWGQPEFFAGESFKSMLYGDFTSNITIVVRRACLDRVGLYDESFQVNEDWELWLRVARYFQFVFVDQVLAVRRWHGDNITGVQSTSFDLHVEGRIRVLDKVFSAPGLPEDIVDLRPVAYFRVYMVAGVTRLQLKAYDQALRNFWAALCSSRNPGFALFHMIAWLTCELFSRCQWGLNVIRLVRRLRRSWKNF